MKPFQKDPFAYLGEPKRVLGGATFRCFRGSGKGYGLGSEFRVCCI